MNAFYFLAFLSQVEACDLALQDVSRPSFHYTACMERRQIHVITSSSPEESLVTDIAKDLAMSNSSYLIEKC